MTPDQRALVRESWGKVEPIADDAAGLFYGRLFERRPDLRPLFKGNMQTQGRKLMQMIGFCVRSLDDPDTLIPQVRALGRRHRDYGVQPEHYDIVGEALLWTLGKGLGDGFTSEVEAAWTETYDVLARTMMEAAAQA